MLSFITEAKQKSLIAGKDSHGAGAHDWGDGVDLLHNALANESGLAEVVFKEGGWPENPAIFNDALRLPSYRMVAEGIR